MKNLTNTQKIALGGILIAFAVVLGTFSIPVGGARISPAQHIADVIGVIILGPWYGVAIAFGAALIRNILGTGTLLAFTSIVGPLVAGLLYKLWHNPLIVAVGEVVGSGLIGSIIAYPIAIFLLGREGAIFMFVVPFLLSTATGAVIAYLFVRIPVIYRAVIGEKKAKAKDK